ncbi:serine protease inhibitor, serpin [Culex quinquefasciatus]|uniref:Serine protease inhibitor, serpin n=1 Tax=Culex quinquefasciatus TaxID=7176 RepID=B0WX66_CULQU|nr:serine protease inhibitor, serpin [Culex quinquefasciatus]|eukprot:XP_001861988.1 serine protease inhibitor, serpin [Culex quinquefasciatus]
MSSRSAGRVEQRARLRAGFPQQWIRQNPPPQVVVAATNWFKLPYDTFWTCFPKYPKIILTPILHLENEGFPSISPKVPQFQNVGQRQYPQQFRPGQPLVQSNNRATPPPQQQQSGQGQAPQFQYDTASFAVTELARRMEPYWASRARRGLIHLANALFVKDGLQVNPTFVDASKGFYNTSINLMDFSGNPQQSANYINQWASDNTYGKINQIVSNYISPETQMIVANALYFKGLWKEMFEKQATTFRKFYPDGHANPSTAKEIPTMAVIGCYPYYDSVEHDAKIVGLPYQGDKTALYIMIPNNSSRSRLQHFQRNLNAQKIGQMVAQMTVRKALVQIPKMKISNTINLRDVLQKLNLHSLFNPATSDLSKMLKPFGPNPDTYYPDRVVFSDSQKQFQQQSQQRLYASEIIHKVELEINEKGTEGGAVTASTIFRSLPSVQMRIDTPFLMMIGHDNTRLPLFYGSIYDPSG